MTTVRDMLRDADPLRGEPRQPEAERDRLRRTILAAAADAGTLSAPWFRRRVVVLAAVAVLAPGLAVVGSQIWPRGGATLQAAVRFEVRLAEAQPTLGLRPARVALSRKVVYLHQAVVVTNDDIAQSRVVEGDTASRFGVGVEFTPAGAGKMRQATAGHIGRPMAILLDGEVVSAPVLKSPIGASALISGDYTKTEAERIVDGMRIR